MDTARLEAFSDGVIAILITIMVLELKVPHGADLEALHTLAPVLTAYVLSFIYLGIYWNNHHHLFQATGHINGTILWANLHLLFWLSLVPFVTNWMGEHYQESLPTAIYGVILFAAGTAYYILQNLIVREQGKNSTIKTALGKDFKGKISPLIYIAAIFLAFVNSYIADALYVLVALIWLVPDRRIEKKIHHQEN